jgi:acetoin utilization protein AcuC
MAWAATKLTSRGLKVAYVDWDAHHGDGVEVLLGDNPTALTMSIHNGEIFPGTGRDGHSPERGIYNWALASGAGDDELREAMAQIGEILTGFRPDVILVACGADGLIGDPLGGLSYTIAGVAEVAAHQIGALAGRLGAPVIVGGAGGYQPFGATPEAWAEWVWMINDGLVSRLRARSDRGAGFETLNSRVATTVVAR